jgi:hypothetical protein
VLRALRKAKLGERPAHQRAQAQQAPLEHGAGASRDTDVPGLQDFEGDDRGVDQVAQLMREKPEALGFARGFGVDGGLIALTPVFSDGARDRIVQAPVQGAEFIRADGHLSLHRQVGDGLTDVAIRMHDLRHGEPLIQEIMTVPEGGVADLHV